MRTLALVPMALAAAWALPAAAQSFRLTQLDVGQGDAAVVVAPGGCAAIVDGGPTGAGALIKAHLRSLGVTSVDFAIASHYHADHIGGLDEVVQGTDALPVGVVYDRGGSYSSATYTEYATTFSGRRVQATLGMTFTLCSQVTFRVVAVNANGLSTTDENARSVAVRVSYGALDLLLGGDLTGSSPNVETLLAPSIGEVEVYKVHHHGSRESSTTTLLDALLPTASFISFGANNPYDHPHIEAINRLNQVGTATWMTEDPATNQQRGHIRLASADGTSFTVTQTTTSQTYPCKGALPDTQAPSVPAGVAASALSGGDIEVSWSASSDDVGVAGYRVWRSAAGGAWALAATTTATSVVDGGLLAGTGYEYQVSAFDAAGNESARSAIVAATTPAPDSTPPTVPLGVTATLASDTQIDVTWLASADDTGVAGYRVWRSAGGGAWGLLGSTAAPFFSDAGLAAGTLHEYRVSAYDAAGNESALSAIAAAATPAPDVVAPSAPAGLVASVVSATSAALAWSPSTDDTAVVAYRIWRDGALRATVDATAWTDTGLAGGTTYRYRVSALDAAGNESALSNEAVATTPAPACTVTVAKSWSAGRRELTVQSTCSAQPNATLVVYGDAAQLGTMAWQSKKSLYELKVRLAARPACVTVTASCGGAVTSCF